jgi:hypothetical protein
MVLPLPRHIEICAAEEKRWRPKRDAVKRGFTARQES